MDSLCNTRLEDGTLCRWVISAKLKFCPDCGAKAKPPAPPMLQFISEPYSWPCLEQQDGSFCGEKLMESYRFCPNCGKNVGSPVCKHCHSSLEKITRFCGTCGGRLLIAAAPNSHLQSMGAPISGVVPAASIASKSKYRLNDPLDYSPAPLPAENNSSPDGNEKPVTTAECEAVETDDDDDDDSEITGTPEVSLECTEVETFQGVAEKCITTAEYMLVKASVSISGSSTSGEDTGMEEHLADLVEMEEQHADLVEFTPMETFQGREEWHIMTASSPVQTAIRLDVEEAPLPVIAATLNDPHVLTAAGEPVETSMKPDVEEASFPTAAATGMDQNPKVSMDSVVIFPDTKRPDSLVGYAPVSTTEDDPVDVASVPHMEEASYEQNKPDSLHCTEWSKAIVKSPTNLPENAHLFSSAVSTESPIEQYSNKSIFSLGSQGRDVLMDVPTVFGGSDGEFSVNQPAVFGQKVLAVMVNQPTLCSGIVNEIFVNKSFEIGKAREVPPCNMTLSEDYVDGQEKAMDSTATTCVDAPNQINSYTTEIDIVSVGMMTGRLERDGTSNGINPGMDDVNHKKKTETTTGLEYGCKVPPYNMTLSEDCVNGQEEAMDSTARTCVDDEPNQNKIYTTEIEIVSDGMMTGIIEMDGTSNGINPGLDNVNHKTKTETTGLEVASNRMNPLSAEVDDMRKRMEQKTEMGDCSKMMTAVEMDDSENKIKTETAEMDNVNNEIKPDDSDKMKTECDNKMETETAEMDSVNNEIKLDDSDNKMKTQTAELDIVNNEIKPASSEIKDPINHVSTTTATTANLDNTYQMTTGTTSAGTCVDNPLLRPGLPLGGVDSPIEAGIPQNKSKEETNDEGGPTKQPSKSREEPVKSKNQSPAAARKEHPSDKGHSPKKALCGAEKLDTNSNRTAYRKSQTSEQDYVPRKNRKKNKQGKSGWKPNHETMVIHFHVIIESEFHYHKKKSSVYIMMGDEMLGKWSPEYKMTVDRDLDDGSTLLSGDLTIPLHILRKKSPFLYKYCLIREESGKHKWEFITYNSGDSNRILKIKSDAVSDGGYSHQYDGFMLKESKDGMVTRTMTKIKSAFTGAQVRNYKKLISVAMKEMLPTWEGFCLGGMDVSLGATLTADEAIAHIQQLRNCMDGWPTCKCLSTYDKDNCWKEVLKDYIYPRINMFKEMAGKQETQEDASLRMSSAMSVVILVQAYRLEMGYAVLKRVMSALQVHPDEEQGTCPDYNGLVTRHFPGKERFLATQLKNFLASVVSYHKEEYRWLNCVPLIHFLEKTSRPYKVPQVIYRTDCGSQMWWGIEGIAYLKDTLMQSLRNEGTLQHILVTLTPLFQVDWLLPRVILASLGDKYIDAVIDTGKLPPEAVLAMVWTHLYYGNVHSSDLKRYLHKLAAVVLTLPNEVSSTLKFDVQHTAAICEVAFSVCMSILDYVILQSVNSRITVHYSSVIQMLNVSIQVTKAWKTLSIKIGERERNKSSHMYDELSRRIDQWLSMYLLPKMAAVDCSGRFFANPVELNLWSDLFNVDMAEGEQIWKRTIITRLKERIVELPNTVTLDVYSYHICFDTHNQEMIDCFSECAFEAAATQIESGQFLDRSRYDAIHSNVWSMFSQVFMKMWPKKPDGRPTNDEQAVLKHIITFPTFKRFLDLLTNEAGSSRLNEECQEYLAVAKSLLFDVVSDLATGQVLVNVLRLILDNSEALLDNAEAAQAWSTEVPDRAVLECIIEWRKLELERLLVYKTSVLEFVAFCNHLGQVDLFDMEEKLHKIDMDLKISALCEVIIYDQKKKDFNRRTPKVTLFDFSADVDKKIKRIIALKGSDVYCKVWQEAAMKATHRAHGEPLTLNQIFNEVWSEAEKGWAHLCQEVQDGSLCLKKVEFAFKHLYMQEDLLETELQYMFPAKKDARIAMRLKEIQRYSTLSLYDNGAKVMLEVKDKLHLKGDFKLLQRILDATKHNLAALNTITEDLVKAGMALADLSPERIYCIETYINCEPLITWIRENIKEVKELKLFVDLALISAMGKGDLEVTRVSCLHAAVSGFAPLIYDLTETAGFIELYQRCNDVWSSYEADKHLPDKLKSLNNELVWLKGVNEAQGDVEVNAIKQVSAINSRGIYVIGHPDRKPSQVCFCHLEHTAMPQCPNSGDP